MLSNYLAELLGILLVLVPLALLVNQKLVKMLFAEAEKESTMFCWSVASLIIGLAIILAHNLWLNSWQTIITIFGWLALLKGLAHLFMPEQTKKWMKKMDNPQWLPVVLVVAVFIGLVITYLGFTA